jgi:hypothetical protein
MGSTTINAPAEVTVKSPPDIFIVVSTGKMFHTYRGRQDGTIDLVYELESCCPQWQAMVEVLAVKAVPARYDSQNAPSSAGDQSSAEPGAYLDEVLLAHAQVVHTAGD